MAKFLKWGCQSAKAKDLGAIVFGIPAFRAADGFVTCPQAGKCAAICYARQGKYVVMPSVRGAREWNIRYLRTHTLERFVHAVCSDLRHIQKRYVRVHDSGDFYSQDYLDAWYEIAALNPRKTFYAYTKSLHLDLWSRRPRNFRLVQSEGGLLDDRIDRNRPHARIFPDHATRTAAGFVDATHSDRPALEGTLHVGLVFHGRYEATSAQKRTFGWESAAPPVDVRSLLTQPQRSVMEAASRAIEEARSELRGTLTKESLLREKAKKLELVAALVRELA